MKLVIRYRSWLLGKSATYYVNAKHDLHVAKILLEYLTDGKPIRGKDENNLRAKRFVDSNQDKDFLASCSFTLIYCNGMMDYWYAFVFSKLAGYGRSLEEIYDYEEILDVMSVHLPWFSLVIGNTWVLDNFAKKQGFDFKIKSSVASNSAIWVQNENIKANKEYVAKIRKLDTKASKVREIIEIGESVYLQENVFIKAAARTQNAANFWDKVFIFLLKFSTQL